VGIQEEFSLFLACSILSLRTRWGVKNDMMKNQLPSEYCVHIK